jgi:hypothetical protein
MRSRSWSQALVRPAWQAPVTCGDPVSSRTATSSRRTTPPGPGGAWQFHWPSLTYGTVHGMHTLPGWSSLTGADPARPSAEVIGAPVDRYERTFDLRVRLPVDVRARESVAA